MSATSRPWQVAGLLVALLASRAVAHESARAVGHDVARKPAPVAARARTLRTRTTWDSVFTTAQVARGQATYGRTCARCHQSSLSGADQSPALTGGAFMSSWNGQTLGDLHGRVRITMPTDTPGTYSRRDVTDAIAYVLSFNGFPAGSAELPVDDDELRAIVFAASKP